MRESESAKNILCAEEKKTADKVVLAYEECDFLTAISNYKLSLAKVSGERGNFIQLVFKNPIFEVKNKIHVGT